MSKRACHPCRVPRFIKPGILLMLSKKESYGYELIKELKEHELVDREPDAGIIYRTLRQYEKQGFVESSWHESDKGPDKRLYKITDKGRANLAEWAEAIEEKVKKLHNFLEAFSKICPEKGRGADK